MIGYVRGTLSHLFDEYCLIDVQGIGYQVYVAALTRDKLAIGKEVSLFTYLNVREDALTLFGFYAQEEYDLFLKLISVTGIGPRLALGILSVIQPQAFIWAISQKNLTVLTKIPGIGKKTAERMILELKDKFSVNGDAECADGEQDSIASTSNSSQEALAALTALGYTQGEVLPIIRKNVQNAATTEDLIKLALKDLARR